MKNIKIIISFIVLISIVFLIILLWMFYFNKDEQVFDLYNIDMSMSNDEIDNSISNINEQSVDIPPKSYTAVIPVYMYHWVREDTGGYEYPEMMVKTSEIKKQFEYLHTNGYDTIFINELDKIYNTNKPIALTFDDGWEDVYNNVFPYAKEYNIKISMYIIKNLVGTAGYCTEEQLKEMKESGLVDIQSHTVTHRKLATLSDDEIYTELNESKEYLKDAFGIDATVICYPSGSFNLNVIKIAEELGYKYGLAMDGGTYYTDRTDKMQITRIFATRSMNITSFINYAEKSNVIVEWE